jgi:predicted NUDIX family NTP pyrophosphohydrolase
MKLSAGLLMYRLQKKVPEFFLVHPGGPFYKNKNEGVWSLPKGLPEPDEDLLITAQREFEEETGITPTPPYTPLGSVTYKSGKVIHAWAFAGQWDPAQGVVSNEIPIEWPPRTGKIVYIPEVDRAAWMKFDEAMNLIHPYQGVFIKRWMHLHT